MSHLVDARFLRAALVVLVALGLFTPAVADEGGGTSASVSQFFVCKMKARDVAPALLFVNLPGDADQMDGCGFGVLTGRKGVKVDLKINVFDDDLDSDTDPVTGRAVVSATRARRLRYGAAAGWGSCGPSPQLACSRPFPATTGFPSTDRSESPTRPPNRRGR